jgi:hypothetical protein
MEKFTKVMRHIKLINIDRRLFWMHLEMHEIVQGAVHVHHDPHMPHVQGQAHGKAQEGHQAHHKLISINRRLFWMHYEVYEAVRGAALIHHDPHGI